MKKHFIFIVTLLVSTSIQSMHSSFFKPTIEPNKPRLYRQNLTSLDLDITTSTANSSFNCKGDKVMLLGHTGPETLLPQFVDPTASLSNTNPVGYALFDGTFKSYSIRTTWTQNIHKSFFFQLNTSLTEDKLSSVSIIPTNDRGRGLSPEEIKAQPKLQEYLKALDQKLFNDSSNTQNRATVGPSYCLMGYTTSFQDFTHLDFIDIAVKTGFAIPLVVLEKTPSKTISLLPKQDIVNWGVPIQVAMTAGVYDWLNLGATATITPYLANDVTVPLNVAPVTNTILIPTTGLCKVHHHPHVSISAYIEGEYFIPRWTWLVGVLYTKQHTTDFTATDTTTFSNSVINAYPSMLPWQETAIILSSEFDLTTEYNQQFMPRCKITYVKRLTGINCFNSSSLGGNLGVEIIYNF